MENNNLEVKVDEIQEENKKGEINSFIIFLSIENKSSAKRKLKINNSIYVTKEREQLKQDWWFSGYIREETVLLPNAHQKAGLIFYKSKLKSISKGDRLYVKIELEKEGILIDYCLENDGEKWDAISIETKIEIIETPTQIAKRLSKKIERFEAIEEKRGARLENLSVIVENTYSTSFFVVGEVYSINGQLIENSFYIDCVIYNNENMIIGNSYAKIFKDDFFCFSVFKIYCDCDYREVSRIRIYIK